MYGMGAEYIKNFKVLLQLHKYATELLASKDEKDAVSNAKIGIIASAICAPDC